MSSAATPPNVFSKSSLLARDVKVVEMLTPPKNDDVLNPG